MQAPFKISKRIFVLFVIAFIVKFCSTLYIAYLTNCSQPSSVHGLIAQKAGDAPSYLDPVDNFIEKGEFYLEGSDHQKIYIGRGPYYGSIYYVIRLFFSQLHAYDVLSLIQIAAESISIVYLALLSLKISGSNRIFWLTYILMLLSLNCTYYSMHLQSESLSISLLIIFCYYYYSYLLHKKSKDLLLSGILLGACVCLKTYYGLLFIPACIPFLLEKPLNFSRIFKNTLVISVPLLIMVAPYTIRNYFSFGKLQPFQDFTAGYSYTKADFAFRKFLQAWGGSIVYWDKRSAACYFVPRPDLNCEFTFPEYAFCDAYNMNDIENAKNVYVRYQKSHSEILQDSTEICFNRLTKLYKTHRPFRYYVITPLICVKEFLFNSGSYYLPIRSDFACYHSYQMLIKYLQSALYWSSLLFGTIGLLLILKRNRKTFMICFIPFYLVCFFALVIRITEFRYFVNAYPMLILGLSYFINQVFLKLPLIRNRRQGKNA